VESGLRVLDAMTMRPVVASPSTSIRDVALLMERYGVGSVLIQRGTSLLGIVTETDFVRRAVVEGHAVDRTPISSIMTKDIVTVSPGMDVFDALLLMKDADIRHLPVTDEGKLIGFITMKDILKLQPNLFENIVDMIELREEHRKGRFRELELNDD
jgi:signal-transduction protein with cAMP-binding, CBS, and nucleotidyltransferase domain